MEGAARWSDDDGGAWASDGEYDWPLFNFEPGLDVPLQESTVYRAGYGDGDDPFARSFDSTVRSVRRKLQPRRPTVSVSDAYAKMLSDPDLRDDQRDKILKMQQRRHQRKSGSIRWSAGTAAAAGSSLVSGIVLEPLIPRILLEATTHGTSAPYLDENCDNLLLWVSLCARVCRGWWLIVRESPAYARGLPATPVPQVYMYSGLKETQR